MDGFKAQEDVQETENPVLPFLFYHLLMNDIKLAKPGFQTVPITKWMVRQLLNYFDLDIQALDFSNFQD